MASLSIPARRAGPAGCGGHHEDAPADRCRAWYEAYGPLVYRYIRFHVNSADTAEDLTADTFLKALRFLDHFDPRKGSVRAWIFRIADNTLRDHHRRSRTQPQVSLSDLRDLAADAPSPEEHLLWKEQVARLLKAVAQVSRRDRELVSLRYGSGFQSSAIAEILGMSESAVRKGLSRALRRLRCVLEDAS